MKSQSNQILKFLLLSTILFSKSLIAQPLPMKYGEVSMDDLRMQAHPLDSSASAVILCEYGISEYDFDVDYKYTFHRRVKIFTRNGYDWGTNSITIYSNGNRSRLLTLKGRTYNLDNQGKMVVKELSDDDIFKEKVTKDVFRYRFTLPALRPGTIFEYYYQILDKDGEPNDWSFQHSIPTAYSEYRLKYPELWRFQTKVEGYYRPDTTTFTKGQMRLNVSGGSSTFPTQEYYWRFTNLPSLKDEIYMDFMENYRSKVRVQYLAYVPANGDPPKIRYSSWADIETKISESAYFGKHIPPKEPLIQETAIATLTSKTEEEKLAAIYQYLQKNYRWNGSYSFTSRKDFNEFIKEKEGRSGEISMALFHMLRAAGFVVNPVLISTRSNGLINNSFLDPNQFNHMILRVRLNNKFIFIDPIDKLRPYTLLDQNDLGYIGFLYNEQGGEWIDIQPNGAFGYSMIINAKLKKDGTLLCDFENEYYDYAALSLRKAITNSESDDQVFNYYYRLLPTGLNFTLSDSLEVINKDKINESLIIKGKVVFLDNLSNNMIYFNPILFSSFESNPFKKEERIYPVDMPFPYDLNVNITLEIEEGIEILDTIQNVRMKLPDNSASYSRNTAVEGNKIMINSRFILKKDKYQPDFYKALREFFERYVTYNTEHLAFRLKNSSTALPTSSSNTFSPTKQSSKKTTKK